MASRQVLRSPRGSARRKDGPGLPLHGRRDMYSGAYINPQAVRQRLLTYQDSYDLEDASGTHPFQTSHTWGRWSAGTALCLLCAVVKSLTKVSALRYPKVAASVGPYTKAAVGHGMVAWLGGMWLLVGRRSARLKSNRQFFLLVGALTFLGVGQLLEAHASAFTPFHTLQGLCASWSLAGSMLFLRLFYRSRLTAGKLGALAVCILGMLMVSQPMWFTQEMELRQGINLTEDGGQALHSALRQSNNSKKNGNGMTMEHSSSIKRSNTSNSTSPLSFSLTSFSPHISFSRNSSTPSRSPSSFSSYPTTSPSSAQPSPTLSYATSDNADFVIGGLISSVAGLFGGAWLAVTFVMSDVPLAVLFFWTSLTCGATSAAMALHVEGPLPRRPPAAYLLLAESLGEALLLCGTTAGSRLTNPIVSAALLALALLLNLGVVHVPLPPPASPGGGHLGATSWPEIAGSVVLLSGVVYTYTLEVWRKHVLSRRKQQEQLELTELLDQGQGDPETAL